MRVLMITGDKNLLNVGSDAYARLAIQRDAVEHLDVVYVGPGAWFRALWTTGQYDVVTSQDPLWRGLIALYLSHKLGAKLNVQVHMDLQSLTFFRHVLSQIILRHADSVRVVSEKIKKQVEAYGVRTTITVLPVFIDIERFTHTERKQSEQKTILWIGRLEDEKKPQEALRIFNEIRSNGIDAKLVILGEGRLKEALLHSGYNLQHVAFEGWRDPLYYLQRADVVISTSLHESFGASIVEALAAGVPVVALDVGVAKEAGAIVVPPEKLKDAVIEVLNNGTRGELKLNLLGPEEWKRVWRESLL